MDPSFWLERWQRGETGFHQSQINADLQTYWPRLAPAAAGAAVFVPLCGRSSDMCWLQAQGHRVIGVELSAEAIRSFFAGLRLEPQRRAAGRLECWHAGGYELYVGDVFDLDAAPLAGVRGAYDRAALVALPPALRARYAAHLQAILPAACPVLLIALDYPQQQMPGPPFAVEEAEVRSLFAQRYAVTLLGRRDTLAAEPRFRQRGVQRLAECSYLLEPLTERRP